MVQITIRLPEEVKAKLIAEFNTVQGAIEYLIIVPIMKPVKPTANEGKIWETLGDLHRTYHEPTEGPTGPEFSKALDELMSILDSWLE